MASKRKKGTSKALTIFLITISIFDLLFLYYTKYHNHGLSLLEFNFSIGNFLNIFFTTVLVVGLILAAKRETNVRVVTFFIVLMTLFLISTNFITIVDLPSPEYYLFNHPFPDILTASLFCAYQVTQFLAISLLWSKIRDRDNLIYVKAAGNAILLSLILLVFGYLFTGKDVDTKLEKSNHLNIGVVLGAAVWSYDKPSPTLTSRLDKAVELYHYGLLQKIQLTGSNAPGELTEAEVAFKYIMNRGVPPEDIFYEDKTTSTSEQIKFVKENLSKRKELFNIVIISDNYHLPRIMEITKFYNLRSDLAGAKLILKEKDIYYYKFRESIGLVIFWLFAL